MSRLLIETGDVGLAGKIADALAVDFNLKNRGASWPEARNGEGGALPWRLGSFFHASKKHSYAVYKEFSAESIMPSVGFAEEILRKAQSALDACRLFVPIRFEGPRDSKAFRLEVHANTQAPEVGDFVFSWMYDKAPADKFRPLEWIEKLFPMVELKMGEPWEIAYEAAKLSEYIGGREPDVIVSEPGHRHNRWGLRNVDIRFALDRVEAAMSSSQDFPSVTWILEFGWEKYPELLPYLKELDPTEGWDAYDFIPLELTKRRFGRDLASERPFEHYLGQGRLDKALKIFVRAERRVKGGQVFIEVAACDKTGEALDEAWITQLEDEMRRKYSRLGRVSWKVKPDEDLLSKNRMNSTGQP